MVSSKFTEIAVKAGKIGSRIECEKEREEFFRSLSLELLNHVSDVKEQTAWAMKRLEANAMKNLEETLKD